MEYVLDRFEGDLAVLETPERTTVDVPRSLLPAEAREGSHLRQTDGGWVVVSSEDGARIRQKFQRLVHPEG